MSLCKVLTAIITKVELSNITVVKCICCTTCHTLCPVWQFISIVIIAAVEEKKSLHSMLIGKCAVVIDIRLQVNTLRTE